MPSALQPPPAVESNFPSETFEPPKKMDEVSDDHSDHDSVCKRVDDEADDEAPPRSPCRSRKQDSYDLIPPPVQVGEVLEGQVIDVTYRDHAMVPGMVTEVDDDPTALRIDLHLVDVDGRTVVATVEKFEPQVRFVCTSGTATKQAVDDLCATIAWRIGRHQDELLATKKQSCQSLLVGFDPLGSDPVSRRTCSVVQLTFPTHEMASRARRVHPGTLRPFEVADHRCDTATSFLIERNIDACGWVQIRRPRLVELRTSSSQIEVVCTASDVTPSERREMAPLLVASYDIETYGSRGAGVFPDPDVDGDYICAITTCLWRAGAPVNDGSTS